MQDFTLLEIRAATVFADTDRVVKKSASHILWAINEISMYYLYQRN